MKKIKVKKPVEVIDKVDLSIYNCPDCKGTGLLDERTRCPRCQGTGKI